MNSPLYKLNLSVQISQRNKCPSRLNENEMSASLWYQRVTHTQTHFGHMGTFPEGISNQNYSQQLKTFHILTVIIFYISFEIALHEKNTGLSYITHCVILKGKEKTLIYSVFNILCRGHQTYKLLYQHYTTELWPKRKVKTVHCHSTLTEW